jgi:hypothetical protein
MLERRDIEDNDRGDKGLQEAPVSPASGKMPVHSDVFGICRRGDLEIWTDRRDMESRGQINKVQSVVPGRIRPLKKQ